MRRPTLLTLLLFFAAVTVSYADTAVGYLDFGHNMNPVPPQGKVTLTLNGDGTIAADLTTFFHNIEGFGFNSALANLPESGFSPTAPADFVGFTDDFGTNASGFDCPSCGMSESWTIGTTGEFTSVYDVLDGGSNSSVDFFLLDSEGEGTHLQFGGDAQSATPEPGSLALIVTGLLSAFAASRRKRPAWLAGQSVK